LLRNETLNGGFTVMGLVKKTEILPDVLYACETSSLALREENTLKVFNNRVLRISVPKREAVTGGWRKMHNNELHNLYSLPDSIRMIKRKKRNAYMF
jgi:hypothetical protein